MKKPADRRSPNEQRSASSMTNVHDEQKGSVTERVEAVRSRMRESGHRIEADHARKVAMAERIQHELREQIKIATGEGERQWERLRESAKLIAREGRTIANKAKGITL